MQEYAADGLRTLALAYRDLSEDEWEAWSESHRCADRASTCREDRLAAAYEAIEQDMMVSPSAFVCLRILLSLSCMRNIEPSVSHRLYVNRIEIAP